MKLRHPVAGFSRSSDRSLGGGGQREWDGSAKNKLNHNGDWTPLRFYKHCTPLPCALRAPGAALKAPPGVQRRLSDIDPTLGNPRLKFSLRRYVA
eukprot:8932501-Pyramimonas_sp.AAC.1